METTIEYGWEVGKPGPGSEGWAKDLNKWLPCREHVHSCDGIVHRRRIDPGDGWEIVPFEEASQWRGEDREGIHGYYRGKWSEAENPFQADLGITYRRRKQSPSQPVSDQPSCRWVRTSERLPEPEKQVLIFWNDGTNAMAWVTLLSKRWGCTHGTIKIPPDYWLDAPSPPAPVDEAEEAYENLMNEIEAGPTAISFKDCFKAGFRAGQQSSKREKK